MILLLAWWSADAEAGAWTRSRGEYYAKLGADVYVAGDYVVPGGGDAATQSYVGQQYGAYAELGLSSGHPVQLAASVPFTVGAVAFERSDTFQTATGRIVSARMGDLRFRPQVALHRDLPLAVAVEVKVPLYAVDRICADEGPYRDLCPRPGDGQVDLTEWVLAGASLAALPLWGEVGLGYQHRTEWFVGWDTDLQLADAVVWAATVGANAGALIAMVKADGAHPLRDDGVTPGAVRLGPGVLYTVGGEVGLEARAQWDVQARAASRGMSVGAGVSVRR